MKDKLKIMFEKQFELQKKLGIIDKIDTPQDKQAYINQTILAVVEEAVEIMKETPYKNPDFVKFGWKKGQEGNPEKMKEEIIDLFHFVMNLSIATGMDSDEFFELYCKKNNINHKRQKNNY